jgi:hypothetical protein
MSSLFPRSTVPMAMRRAPKPANKPDIRPKISAAAIDSIQKDTEQGVLTIFIVLLNPTDTSWNTVAKDTRD